MSRTALITGASSGIGAELAKLYARDGVAPVLVARGGAAMEDLAQEVEERYGVTATVIAKDLSAAGASQEVFHAVSERGLVIDYLINAAGFADWGALAESDLAKLTAMMDVNVIALTQMTRLFLPGMIERGHGRVAALGSMASFEPGPFMAVYHASKAYVLSLSVALNEELRGTGVTATALCPPPYRSTFQDRAVMQGSKLVHGKKLPSAAEMAEWGYRAIESGRPWAVPGFKWRLAEFGFRIMPRTISARIVRKANEHIDA